MTGDSIRPTAERHVPVMRDRVLELLVPALAGSAAEGAPALFVDATLGMGGHTEAVLAACPQALAIGIDRDPQALALATERLAAYGDRFRPVRAVYDAIADVVADAGRDGFGDGTAQAILFDLGVSSLQLDEADRGFAYRVDAPLDMRMDPESGPTAADIVNTYTVAQLTTILSEYGEERFARRIARAIVADRVARPFTTTGALVDLLRSVIPAASQRQSGHPAKRTFQALRIEVNGELTSWEAALPSAVETLSLSGRVAVLSYHSLEDRIAKRVFRQGSQGSTPPGLPVELADHAPYLALLTRGAEEPGPDEVVTNPRAASAKLRVAQRIRVGSGTSPGTSRGTSPGTVGARRGTKTGTTRHSRQGNRR